MKQAHRAVKRLRDTRAARFDHRHYVVVVFLAPVYSGYRIHRTIYDCTCTRDSLDGRYDRVDRAGYLRCVSIVGDKVQALAYTVDDSKIRLRGRPVRFAE